MQTLKLSLFALLVIVAAPVARAQETAWIQIEAVRSLALAQDRARDYGQTLRHIGGFRVPGGWYAIALGPYAPDTARDDLAALKRADMIPSDSFIVGPGTLREQFWPLGADTRNAPPVAPQAPALTGQPLFGTPPDAQPTEPEPEPTTDATTEPAAPPEETPAEARASERQLTLAERQLLQEALQWEGVYDAAIDGAFGAGTRNAMAAWQRANGHRPTGILTTLQRAELIAAFQADFADLGLATLSDANAGIEILAPLGKVAYARTEAPFVHYDATDADGMRLVLISQTGGEATLFGLYDVMQTLEIVPLDGFRERKARSFVLTGQGAELHSHTYAEIAGETVKGFTLVWKPGNARVMDRVIALMKASFQPVEGVVLPDTALSDDGSGQRIDLMAGLEIRRPVLSRTGFFVDDSGLILTTTEVLGTCRRITIGDEIGAEVVAQDAASGLALLEPETRLAPISVAAFHPGVPRLKTEVTLAGFSYEDVLDLPVLTYGALEDINGLDGETQVDRLALTALPGDAGGPVIGPDGAVVGMLQPRDETGRRSLPEDVRYSVDAARIVDFLSAAGVAVTTAETGPALPPEDLTTLAGDIAVRVSCWN